MRLVEGERERADRGEESLSWAKRLGAKPGKFLAFLVEFSRRRSDAIIGLIPDGRSSGTAEGPELDRERK